MQQTSRENETQNKTSEGMHACILGAVFSRGNLSYASFLSLWKVAVLRFKAHTKIDNFSLDTQNTNRIDICAIEFRFTYTFTISNAVNKQMIHTKPRRNDLFISFNLTCFPLEIETQTGTTEERIQYLFYSDMFYLRNRNANGL